MDMDSDNRFDNELSEKDMSVSEEDMSLSEEDMARATEVVVPAPRAKPMPCMSSPVATPSVPTPGNQAVAYVSPRPSEDVPQQEFPSAALSDDGGRRVSLGRAAGVSAAVGVAGVCVASVLTKEDASLSRAATPDDEKTAHEIASNIGVGDDVARVEVPAEPHVTVTYEDMTAAGAAESYGSEFASADYAGCAGADVDLTADFDDIYDTMG